jgi:hypothetical protein
MRTKLMVFVGILGVACGIGGYVIAQGLPFGPLPLFTPGSVLTADQLNEIVKRVNAIVEFINRGPDGAPKEIPVDCTKGDTIANALNSADEGDTIKITGTCHETVTVFEDGLTLDGQGTAVIDGGGGTQPVIDIVGARGVTIKGLTVQNGLHGIRARGGAAVVLTNVKAQDNTEEGISIEENSTARLTDCTVLYSSDNGIQVVGASHAFFQGSIVSNDNGDDGIFLFNSANANFNGATVQTNNNGDAGLNITTGSSAVFNSSTFEASNNTSDGMRLQIASAIISANVDILISHNGNNGFQVRQNSAMDFFDGTLRSTNNRSNGIFVDDGAGISIFGGRQFRPSTVELSGNAGNGLSLGHSAHFRGGDRPNVTATITGNGGNGVRADDGATVTINDSTITGNTGTDVTAFFGSRLTLNGNTIGTITCDETVLSRGSTMCPD